MLPNKSLSVMKKMICDNGLPRVSKSLGNTKPVKTTREQEITERDALNTKISTYFTDVDDFMPCA
jgi:hypothetical protein